MIAFNSPSRAADDFSLRLPKATRFLWGAFITLAALFSHIATAQDRILAERVARWSPSTEPGQSATQLSDGRWLLLGGRNQQQRVTSNAVIYDTEKDQRIQLPARLHVARLNHTATVAADGSVIVIGGVDAYGQPVTQIERFQPDKQLFEVLGTVQTAARSQHTAILLMDGKLLLTGGLGETNQVLNDAALLSVDTLTVEQLPALPNERFDHRVARLPNDLIYFWGGLDRRRQALDGGAFYNVKQQKFIAPEKVSVNLLPSDPLAKIAPVVVNQWPAAKAKNVDVTAVIGLQFSTPQQAATLHTQSVTLIGPNGPVDIKVSAADGGLLAFVEPIKQLLPASRYTLFLQGVKSVFDAPLPFYATDFLTGAITIGNPKNNSAQVNASAWPAGTKVISPIGIFPNAAQRLNNSAFGDPKAEFNLDTVQRMIDEAADFYDDSDIWIPGPSNYRNNWRSGWADRARTSEPSWTSWRRLGDTARFASTFKRLQPAPNTGRTVISGQVLRLNGRPLAGVTLSMGNQKAVSNRRGEFQLSDVPAGIQVLSIDGRTANTKACVYGRYDYQMMVEAGRTNALDFPIWMSRLDMAHAVKISSPTTQDTVITNPYLPGLEMHLPAGSVVRDADGKIATEISITPIPADQPPFPMLHAEVPVYYTIQPGGAVIEGVDGKPRPAKLKYPNYSGQPRGARFQLFGYDPSGRGWYDYAIGRVSDDGKQLVSDHDFLLYQFSAASAASPGGTPPDEGPQCTDASCTCPSGGAAGDPVSCADGIFIEKNRDLTVSDVLPLTVDRVYRSKDANQRAFGVGSNSSFDLYLNLVGQTYYAADSIELVLPNGGRVPFNVVGATGYYTGPGVYYESTRPGEFYKATISLANPGWGNNFYLKLKDGRRYAFSYYQSRLLWVEDRFGNRITLSRDSYNRISRLTSPNGRFINYLYTDPNCTSCISQLQDNSGRTVGYQYDASGRLIQVTDAEGGITQYSYDPITHNMLSVQDARGKLKVANEYYGIADGAYVNGRVKRQTYGDNSTNDFAYTFDGNGRTTQTEVTDERGVLRRLEYTASHYITRETRAVGKPEQQVVTNSWGTNNLLTSTTDALGRTTAYEYDAKGNTTKVTQLPNTSEQVIWSYTYEPTFNQLKTITDPLSHTTTYTYDAFGNLTKVTDALTNAVTLTYNAAGQVKSAARTAAGVTMTQSFAYTGGDLISQTDPLARTTTFATDAVGRTISIKDPLGNTTRLVYDKLDRVIKSTEPLGQTVQMGFDPNGNLIDFTDSNNHITHFVYDDRNRLLSKTDPLGHTESYQYDPSGNLKQITDRKDQVTGFTYDFLNRRIGAGFGATTASPTSYLSTVTYGWDNGNRLRSATDSMSGAVTQDYDNLDRMTQEQSPQGRLNYTYYPNHLRQSMTVLGQPSINYTYDNANRLTQITQNGAAVGFTYDSANRRTSLTLPSGIVASYTFDKADQLTGLSYQKGATALGNLTYGYDTAGRRITTGGTLAQTALPTAVTSSAVDDANRLTQWGGQAIAYDDNGAMTAQGAQTFEWDERQRLKQIKAGSTVIASFSYDALNRRIHKTVGSTATNFLHDGWQIVQELNGAMPTANLLTGPGLDQLYRRTEGATVNDYLTDALGSTIALTDSSGVIRTNYKYEPYGSTTAIGTASNNAFQYTGRENDNTGLYYYRNRYYSPATQRFISEDPLGFDAGQNIYGYVEGNPVKKADPFGLASCTFTMSTGRLVCTPNNAQNAPVDIPVASGNNGGGQECRNNPQCTAIPNHGPIPTGCWRWTNGATNKPNGRVLEPCPGTNTNVAENRTLIRSHSCANPFGPGLGPQYCSEGCVTGTAPGIQNLNTLIDAEPGSTLQVNP